MMLARRVTVLCAAGLVVTCQDRPLPAAPDPAVEPAGFACDSTDKCAIRLLSPASVSAAPADTIQVRVQVVSAAGRGVVGATVRFGRNAARPVCFGRCTIRAYPEVLPAVEDTAVVADATGVVALVVTVPARPPTASLSVPVDVRLTAFDRAQAAVSIAVRAEPSVSLEHDPRWGSDTITVLAGEPTTVPLIGLDRFGNRQQPSGATQVTAEAGVTAPYSCDPADRYVVPDACRVTVTHDGSPGMRRIAITDGTSQRVLLVRNAERWVRERLNPDVIWSVTRDGERLVFGEQGPDGPRVLVMDGDQVVRTVSLPASAGAPAPDRLRLLALRGSYLIAWDSGGSGGGPIIWLAANGASWARIPLPGTLPPGLVGTFALDTLGRVLITNLLGAVLAYQHGGWTTIVPQVAEGSHEPAALVRTRHGLWRVGAFRALSCNVFPRVAFAATTEWRHVVSRVELREIAGAVRLGDDGWLAVSYRPIPPVSYLGGTFPTCTNGDATIVRGTGLGVFDSLPALPRRGDGSLPTQVVLPPPVASTPTVQARYTDGRTFWYRFDGSAWRLLADWTAMTRTGSDSATIRLAAPQAAWVDDRTLVGGSSGGLFRWRAP